MTEHGVLKPGESIKVRTNLEEIKKILDSLYGVTCLSIVELNGYDDKNYKVTVKCSKHSNVDDSKEYVFKIMNSLDSKNILLVEGQNNIMLFLSQNDITCSKPVKNISGNYFSVEKFSSGKHVVRLLEYIPGKILNQIHPTPLLFYQVGQYAANLDVLLKNFYHPVYDTYKTIWKMDCIPAVKQFLFAIEDDYNRKLMEKIIDEFEERVLKVCDNFEKGMIYGDVNEQNIIVEDNDGQWIIKGIIDFGDCSYSCYLFELAVAVTYMMIIEKDIDAAAFVIAGYTTVRNLTDQEFSLLKICVLARLCESLIIGCYTNMNEPNNLYVLSCAKNGWDLLQELHNQSEKTTLDRWASMSKNFKETVKNDNNAS